MVASQSTGVSRYKRSFSESTIEHFVMAIPSPEPEICHTSVRPLPPKKPPMQRAHPPRQIKKRKRALPTTILICGSPADGFQIVGLFADRDDAQSYAEDHSLTDWWIAE